MVRAQDIDALDIHQAEPKHVLAMHDECQLMIRLWFALGAVGRSGWVTVPPLEEWSQRTSRQT